MLGEWATFRLETVTRRTRHRLDAWFHGRGETLSELDFIAQRNNPSNLGEFAPSNAIVLHPYGRYCNANHFAGEIDTFEAQMRRMAGEDSRSAR